MSIEIRPLREDERDTMVALSSQAFNVAPSRIREAPSWPAELARGAVVDGELVAMLRTHQMGHYFGGRAVPSVGIGGVAVAGHARGKRVAETMMIETLREFRETHPISMLYPATVPLYRRCGYEYAAYRFQFKAPLDGLPRVTGGPDVTPWTPDDQADVEACYRRWAATTSGVVDRPAWWWRDRILHESKDQPLYRYVVRENGDVTGYTIYTQEKHGEMAWGFDIECRDLVWLTPAAGAALLAFAGRNRSTGVNLLWAGSPNDALANLLPEQDAEHFFSFRQMLRLIDVAAAFEARGFPMSLEAAVELQVQDPAFGWNDAGWRIDVSGGAAKVAQAPGARARIEVGTLGALYSGMLSAKDARRLGTLDANDDEVATLDAMLAGPAPFVNDWF